MDIRYMLYAVSNKKYYAPNKRKRSMLRVPDLPIGWEEMLDEEKHWRYCIQKNVMMPNQGWKIHISCNAPEAQEMLDTVAPILFNEKVDFKFVCSKMEIEIKNSKYGNRGASGKFITIYPTGEEQFLRLLDILDEATKHIKKGPYILSDKRWKDHNVYFRYGGFAQMFVTIDGEKQLAIMNEKGELIPDVRSTTYVLPDFVKEPIEIIKMDKEREEKENLPSKLDDYNITEALHFSNGGGVYLAQNKEGEEVVIKEGRPGAAVDANTQYAYDRIKVEIEALKKLRGTDIAVQYIDDFIVWEHIFLVEEKVEGATVNTWMALNYPFVEGTKNQADYKDKVIKIIRNIIDGMKIMHSLDVAMGDISLTNIMVNVEDMSVKFIDFESAGSVETDGMPGLGTVGYMTALAKSRGQNDWFGILRIARHLFLPICDIDDFDPAVDYKIDKWIENTIGIEAISLIREIENLCSQQIIGYDKKFKPENNYYRNRVPLSLPQFISKLRNTMVSELKLESILLHGDIRQYEIKGGKYNVLTGGFGIALALARTGELPLIAKQWVEKYSNRRYMRSLDMGLFTGRTGVATVLYELGYKKEAHEIISTIDIESVEMNNISIMSGLAGIGLAFVSLSVDEMFSDLLGKAILIGEKLLEAAQRDVKIFKIDEDFISMGLIDGWAGVSLFFNALYRATQNDVWLNASVTILQKDINNCVRDEDGLLQADDTTRVLPYIAGGSAGIALVIDQIRDIVEPHKFDKDLEDILKLHNTQVCYNGGLFRGYGSFIMLDNLLHCYKPETPDMTDKILNRLNNYTVEDERNLYMVGDYGRRISHDIFTGSAGVLLALSDVGRGRYMSWFPIPQCPYLRT